MGQSSTAKKRASRDAASKVAQQRLSVLELARGLGNAGSKLAHLAEVILAHPGGEQARARGVSM